MTRPNRGGNWVVAVLSCLLVLALAGAAHAAAPELQLVPNEVEIGAFFEGAQVELQGTIPAGAEAVVEMLGSTATEELLRKGRRGGLWMSVGEIKVNNVPSLYLLQSSSPEIPALTGQETPWGFAALQKVVKLSGSLEASENDKFFQEFLELKKHEQVYRVSPGILKISPAPGGGSLVKGVIPLPAKVPPGKYQVRLSAVLHGSLLSQRDAALEVRMVGFPAMLMKLAHQQGALYGILAVVIAIVTGFIMGILFKGKTEH